MTRNDELVPPAHLELDRYLEAFESAAAHGACPLDAFVPPRTHPQYRAIMLELLRVDLELAWGRGEARHVCDYEARFPDLLADPETRAVLRFEEERQRHHTKPFPTSAVGNVPVWMGDGFPTVGTVLPPDQRIIRELGRGAFGRVYLAEEAGLAGRWVAVKVSSKLLHEAQTLARLQHTNIVPIYAAHHVGDYQVVVMPFFGAATLADVLQVIHAGETIPMLAETLASVVQAKAIPHDITPPTSTKPIPALQRWEHQTHLVAILELAEQLADGLQHAHDRGIQHRDLKPANILLTDDGRPMLLDFNLATDEHLPDDAPLGGTPRYMAPEQLDAMLTNKSLVGPTADVYALGLIMYELLIGALPFKDHSGSWRQVAAAALAERRHALRVPHPSPAVTAILRRCLAPVPTDRYPTAAALRDDLRAHLAAQPLVHTREPWSRERFRKWRNRHPRLTSAGTVGIVALLVVVVVAGLAFTNRERARTLTATAAFEHAEQTRGEVRALVLQAHAPSTQYRDARALTQAALRAYTTPTNIQYLSSDQQTELAEVLAELHYHDAEAAHFLAAKAPDPAPLLAEALHANEQGLGYGSSLARLLLAQRVRLLVAAKQDVEAERVQRQFAATPENAVSAPFLQALTALQGKHYQEARAKLLTISKPTYAVWMALGLAYRQLHEYDLAADAYLAATALGPDEPWAYLERGATLLDAQAYTRARTAFARLIELRPDEPVGHINQALALFHLQEFDAALRALDTAATLGATGLRVHAVRERCYRRLNRVKDAEAARTQALAATPTDATEWTIRGEMYLGNTPPNANEAIVAFDRALALDGEHLPALRGKISALAENLKQPKDTLPLFRQLLALNPRAVDNRAGYAVILARLGETPQARSEARQCLRDAQQAVTIYQAASALALSASTPSEKREVLDALRTVLQREPHWATEMVNDPDLQSVRGEPSFRDILQAARVLQPKP